jgi:hypothetical protein
MKLPLFVCVFLAVVAAAFAQNPDDYRGGWKTEANGTPRIYEFSIRGATVRGVYCSWCNDATTLSFIDGKFSPAGITFTVTHVDNNGKTTDIDTGTAVFEKPNLIVTGKLGGRQGGDFRWVMLKDERGPDPLPIPIVMLTPRDVPILGRGGAAAPGGRRSTGTGSGRRWRKRWLYPSRPVVEADARPGRRLVDRLRCRHQ